MTEPPASIAAATLAGEKSTTGVNPYKPSLVDVHEAFHVAYDASTRQSAIRLQLDRVAMFEDTISVAKAGIAEALAEIDRLQRPRTEAPVDPLADDD